MGCLRKFFYKDGEYTVDELAAKYGISPKTVRSRLKGGTDLELKRAGRSGRKSKYPTFNWNGEEISMSEALHRCHCNKNTLYKYIHEGKTLDEIKALLEKKRVADDGKSDYEPGWITLEQVSKKCNIPYTSLSWIVRSRGIERKNFVSMHGKRMAIKRVDLEKAVNLTREMLSKQEQKNAVKAEEKEKTLEELRKEHPLVKDDRFFQESYFPPLEYFHVEDWLGKPAEVEQ